MRSVSVLPGSRLPAALRVYVSALARECFASRLSQRNLQSELSSSKCCWCLLPWWISGLQPVPPAQCDWPQVLPALWKFSLWDAVTVSFGMQHTHLPRGSAPQTFAPELWNNNIERVKSLLTCCLRPSYSSQAKCPWRHKRLQILTWSRPVRPKGPPVSAQVDPC